MSFQKPIKRMPTGRMLRLGRIVVSVALLAASTILFASANAKLVELMGWSQRVQILPLALASCLSTIGFWVVITLIFGRIYCSTVCPLGTLQDVIARVPRLDKRYRAAHPYHFVPAQNFLRYGLFILAVACISVGFVRIVALISPFDMFGQMATNFIRPIARWLGGKQVMEISAYSFVISLVTLGALVMVATRRGRLFCNTLCPVGAGLGIFSRFSVYHFDIDTDRCTNCRRCEYACKAQCINLDDHLVDGSRCVVCFDCVDSCQDGAIRYTRRRKQLSVPMLQRIATPSMSLSADSPIAPSAEIPIKKNPK